MSQNIINNPTKPPNKDETHSSNSKKTAPPSRPQDQPLKCPRCDSPNTKFCYYNNYSLTQPRHFCKTCRRYWTKGGALRNVPIGGGCRKSKKTTKSSSSSRLSSSCDSKEYNSGSSPPEMSGLKFFHGISPAMDFQLGGLSSFPRGLHHHPSPTGGIYTQFSSFADISSTSAIDPSGGSSAGSLMGFNFPLFKQGESNNNGGLIGGAIQEMGGGSMNVHSNLASSIESLSSINQDLHWKLQQQRLANMLFNGGDQNQQKLGDSTTVSSLPLDQTHVQRPQPILFHNLEISKPDACGARKEGSSGGGGDGGGQAATEWFFDSSYHSPSVTAAVPANGGGNGNHDNTNSWNGIQAWNDHLHQYSSLP